MFNFYRRFCISWWCSTLIILVSIPIGLFSLIATFELLWCNEKPALSRAQTLKEGEQSVIPIDAYRINFINEGKLVHLSEEATTNEIITDTLFEVVVFDVIKLKRVVERYQWGSWSKYVIDSYRNPSSMQLSGKTYVAKEVKLGDLTLPSSLVDKMSHSQWLPMKQYTFDRVQNNFSAQFPGKKIHLHNGNYYVGQNPANPQRGDLRIRFEIVPTETMSVVAKQVGSRLTSYQDNSDIELFGLTFKRTYRGCDIKLFDSKLYRKDYYDRYDIDKIELFKSGKVTVERMFIEAKIEHFINHLSARHLFGFLTLFLGFYMTFLVLSQLLNLPHLPKITFYDITISSYDRIKLSFYDRIKEIGFYDIKRHFYEIKVSYYDKITKINFYDVIKTLYDFIKTPAVIVLIVLIGYFSFFIIIAISLKTNNYKILLLLLLPLLLPVVLIALWLLRVIALLILWLLHAIVLIALWLLLVIVLLTLWLLHAIVLIAFWLLLVILLSIYKLLLNIGKILNKITFLVVIVSKADWLSLLIVTATLSVSFIALIWINYLPVLGTILLVIALSFLYLLKFSRKLFKAPTLYWQEPTLIQETFVPLKN